MDNDILWDSPFRTIKNIQCEIKMDNLIFLKNTKYFFYDEEILCLSDSSHKNINDINKIYCIGTPLYKGVSIELVFESVLKDFYSKKLSYKDVKGNFLIIFIKNKSIKVLSDRTHQHHLFYDYNTKTLSTSFLELVKLNRGKLKLNTYGFYEKVALGFHLGEDTLFEHIVRINPENAHKVDVFDIEYLNDHTLPQLDQIRFHSVGKKESLQCQNQQLNSYFSLVDQTFVEQKGDLGLSGGFDCRLLLALAQKNISQPLHLHTHATAGVHEGQSQFADKLAECYGVNLVRISTTSPSQLDSASFTQMLDDNIAFFDGRSARHLGAYSQTYTENYKRESMGIAHYSLNGLGGEIYRDSYFTGSKKMSWDEWAERYLFLAGAKAIVPQVRLENLSINIKNFLEDKLRWKKDYYDILFTHAYYGLIKMPLCNGSVVSAYNRVSPFLLPFIEYENVIEALKAIPYLGVGGQYQARLITDLSPTLANLPTSYGNTFKSLGFKYYLWSFIKTLGSVKRRDAMVLKILVEKASSASAKREFERLNELTAFQQGVAVLSDLDDHLNLNVALIESTHKRNITLLGYFLGKYL